MAGETANPFRLLFSPSIGSWSYVLEQRQSRSKEAYHDVLRQLMFAIPPSIDLLPRTRANRLDRLFERGALHVGLDFLAHPYWDKYLEFEQRMDRHDRVFAIFTRLIEIPMHQYARYFEKFRTLAQHQPLTAICPDPVLTQIQLDLENENLGYRTGRSQVEVERDIRLRIDTYHVSIFQRTQGETTKRWPYESEIKRPYFHVTDLEDDQLVNWRKYLDFEESETVLQEAKEERNYHRTQFLYERCLVSCAQYEEFWLRYVRWTASFGDKTEEIRNIYQRASCIFVPIACPTVRLQYAYFEEMQGRVDVAKAIHEAILLVLPGDTDTVVSYANLVRRHDSLPEAMAVYQTYMETPSVSQSARAQLVAESARLLIRHKGIQYHEEARQIFTKAQSAYSDSREFWHGFMKFEIDLPIANEGKEKQHNGHVKHVLDACMAKGKVAGAVVHELVLLYMTYLLERGGKEGVQEYIELDREWNGPDSVKKILRRDLESSKKLANGRTKH